MIEIQTYHRQNKIQKVLMGIIRMFKPDLRAVQQLKAKGIGVYTPKKNKLKIGIMSIGCLFCLATFGTNWAIPFIVKWGLK